MSIKNNIKAISYSRIANYMTCPLQFAHKNILKTPQPERNWAMDRGTILHAKAEQFVLGNIKGTPDELKPFQYELIELKRLQASAETDLTITQGWQPTHAKDWTGAWCRTKVDSTVVQDEVGTAIDYKTGKMYDSHELQGEIDVVSMFIHFPNVEQVDVEFWYFDLPKGENVMVESYDRSHFEKLKKKIIKITTPIFRDTKFKPKLNNYCYNCYVRHLCPAYKD